VSNEVDFGEQRVVLPVPSPSKPVAGRCLRDGRGSEQTFRYGKQSVRARARARSDHQPDSQFATRPRRLQLSQCSTPPQRSSRFEINVHSMVLSPGRKQRRFIRRAARRAGRPVITATFSSPGRKSHSPCSSTHHETFDPLSGGNWRSRASSADKPFRVTVGPRTSRRDLHNVDAALAATPVTAASPRPAPRWYRRVRS
jgi:hypothetical protein